MQLKTTLLTLFAATVIFQARAEIIVTNTYSAPAGQVMQNEQWVMTETADVSGTFENDLGLMSGTAVDFSGIYQGNVWACSSLEIVHSGSCERNFRAAAATIKIEGQIAGNLLAFGDTVVLGSNSVVHGNVIIRANTIVQEGRIAGDADFTGMRITTLSGSIGGNATLFSADPVFTKEAHIKGDLEYRAENDLFLDEGIVGGNILRAPLASAEPIFSTERLLKILTAFLAALIAGIPFITLFPMTTAMSAQLIRNSFWKCLFVGFVTSIALPTFGIMSITSLIGLPLGALLIGAWAAMVYLSRIIMALVIGNLILRNMDNSIGKVIAAMAAGLALISLSALFPTLGIPVQILVLWLGMGSLILALIEKRRLILQVPTNLKKLQQLRDEKYNPSEEKKS